MSYLFKPAETPAEFEQIRRPNHRAFAEELGQHGVQANGLLIDPLEQRSRYFVAIHRGSVAGMLCTHDDPPFTIEKRLPSSGVLDELPGPLLEVRLLAFDPAHRRQSALLGLFGCVFEKARAQGFRTMLISGVTLQLRLYRRLGFVPLGPAVPDGKARFVPMALDLETVTENLRALWRRYRRRTSLTFLS